MRQGSIPRPATTPARRRRKPSRGVLIGLDLEPPRTHALERLVESLREAGVEVEPFRELQLRVLSGMTSSSLGKQLP